MAGRWVMNADGVFVPKTTWSGSEPTNHGITPGKAPAGIVKNPSAAPKPQRRFDAVTPDQIKQYMKEDEEYTKKVTDIAPTVRESKLELQSGKMRVDPDIFPASGGISPYKAVEDADGRTHIVREDKVPANTPKIAAAPVAPATSNSPLILPPTTGTPAPGAPTQLKQVMKKGFNAILQSDGVQHLRRTF